MSKRIPLGEKEDHRQEFKGAEALKNPEIIARGVVAMLNAEGGEVWVGLREENERAVAVEPIPDPERERRRLLDHLVDAIEPAPLGREVAVESASSEDGAVLRVIARPQADRKPYAFLKRGGRHFVIRVGPRIRPMTREEIFNQSKKDDDAGLKMAADRLKRDRDQLQKKGDPLFWLGLEPASDLELDLQNRRYLELFQEPRLSQNRPAGWSFAIPYAHGPRLRQDRLAAEDEESNGRTAEIRRNGGMTFKGALDSMFWKGDPDELWPFILLEYPISAFRIAREVYKDAIPSNGEVVTDMALFGIRGWKLRPGSPGRWFLSNRISVFEDADDLVWEKPLIFSAEEIEQEPDRCGYRLVERVYEAFGFRRDQIPKEFDQKSGRLILPE